MKIEEKLVLINQNTLESLEETDRVKIIERFTKTGMEILSADYGFMFWKLENQNNYQIVYVSPNTPYKPKMPRKRGYNYKASQGRIPYFVSKPKKNLLPFMKSLAIIPIFYKNYQYGNIVLCYKKKRIFKPEEKPLVMTFGNAAAQTLTINRNQKKTEKYSQKLLKQKDEFLNIVSHELKTPVTTIKGFSQVLSQELEKRGDKKTRYFLSKINNQVDKLTHLINDLLDVSRIETNRQIFRESTFELEKLIKQVIEELKMSITSHPISFKSSHKIWLHADSQYIEQVMINLITNAAKYSPPRSRIKVTLGEKNKRASIEVEDFGYGIPKKDKTKIFSRFFRSKDSNRENSQGLGLGLYIANSISRHYGGELDFREKPRGKGVIFSFNLPYVKCQRK